MESPIPNGHTVKEEMTFDQAFDQKWSLATFHPPCRHRRPQFPQTSTNGSRPRPRPTAVVLSLNRGQNSLTGEIIKVSAANFVPKREPFLFTPPLPHFSQSLPTLVGLLVRKGTTAQEPVSSIRVMRLSRSEATDRSVRKLKEQRCVLLS